jgi:hypothetical protein
MFTELTIHGNYYLYTPVPLSPSTDLRRKTLGETSNFLSRLDKYIFRLKDKLTRTAQSAYVNAAIRTG